MSIYISILISFIIPFAFTLLLPLWRNRKGETGFVLLMIAAFFWGVALGSLIIYVVGKYFFNGIDFWFAYLIAIGLGLLTLAIWVLAKNYFKGK